MWLGLVLLLYMAYLKYTEKLKSIEYYIQSNSAISINALAEKLAVSPRTVLRMIDTLKEQGKEIKYCRKRKLYLFEKNK